jgi:hypothetical protein
MVNLRQYQTKHNGIRVHWEGGGNFLATNGNWTNKGWHINAVRNIMLFRADLLGLENRIVTDILCSYYKLSDSRAQR